MNVMHKITLQTLKRNRRRTIVTILGTAVAVAMVTAVAVLAASFLQMYRHQSVVESGNWHVEYRGVDAEALPMLEQGENVQQVVVGQEQGFAPLPGRENYTRSRLAVSAYDAAGIGTLPVELLQGRLPQKPGEILLSEAFLNTEGLDWPLGETVELPFGHYEAEHISEAGEVVTSALRSANDYVDDARWVAEGERSFTVVGYAKLYYLEPGWLPFFGGVTVLEPQVMEVPGEPFAAYVLLEDATLRVYNEFDAMGGRFQEMYGEAVQGPYYNSALLSAEGVVANSSDFTSIGLFMGTLLLIILLGSVSLIGNAFSISLTERVRSLGMLAGVGATRRQKSKSVLFEALVIGAFAIPAGVLGGIAGIAVTLALVGQSVGDVFGMSVPMELHVPLWALLFTVVFSAGMLLLSAWLPARRAARIGPVDAMRGTQDVTLRRVRVLRPVRKWFGFEAELGIKNSKRNRRRYYAILSSLAISTVLFLTVSAAMQYIRDGVGLVRGEDNPYNLHVSLSAAEEGLTFGDFEERLADIRAMAGTSEVDALYTSNQLTGITPDKMGPQLRELMQGEFGQYRDNGDGSYVFAVVVCALEEETFARYCERAGLDADVLAGPYNAIQVAPLPVRMPSGAWADVEPATLGVGDVVDASADYYTNTSPEAQVAEVAWTIAAVSDELPTWQGNGSYAPNTVVLVTSLAQCEPLFAQFDAGGTGYNRFLDVYAKSPNSAALYKTLEEAPNDPRFHQYVFDLEEDLQRKRMMLFVFSVFTYGFVALITLVCVANIFNTVSTGILLRTREFAMLRSTGLTRTGFNRMLDCESLFYGVKALAIGMPLSVLLSWLLYSLLRDRFGFAFSLPWPAYLFAALGVFAVTGLSMLYARRKVRKVDIAQALREENW